VEDGELDPGDHSHIEEQDLLDEMEVAPVLGHDNQVVVDRDDARGQDGGPDEWTKRSSAPSGRGG
jgi:hypothetical protein